MRFVGNWAGICAMSQEIQPPSSGNAKWTAGSIILVSSSDDQRIDGANCKFLQYMARFVKNLQ
jgi:hypothetical protein